MIRPITLVEIHGQPPIYRQIEPLPAGRSRDRSLHGKARIRARREARRG